MDRKKDLKLSCVLLEPRNNGGDAAPFVDSAYALWSDVWRGVMSELGGAQKLPSDDFTRHDCLIGIFQNGQAVASVSVSAVDLSLKMWRDDSYFKLWPESSLLDLSVKYPGQRILLGTYFTVAKDWRRENHGISVKRLMMAMTVEHFLRSSCEVMVGTMRVERGMHSLSYDFGAEPLARGLHYYSATVDLLTFDRAKVAATANVEQVMASKMYEECLDYRLIRGNSWQNRSKAS